MNETLLHQILTKSYRTTPDELLPLAERIREVEGVDVTLEFSRNPRSERDFCPGRYDYERAASRKTNVAKWLENRFRPKFPFLKATIYTPQGRVLQEDELVSYARGGTGLFPGRQIEYIIESPELETKEQRKKELSKLKRHLTQFSLWEHFELTEESTWLLIFTTLTDSK
ncbi:hypothetical protein [Rubritalea tangerina]|uniref:hypothetical protein n=1 Tax=Rubritalea tangerina TaxID=430798 RepID=UPI00360EB2BE